MLTNRRGAAGTALRERLISLRQRLKGAILLVIVSLVFFGGRSLPSHASVGGGNAVEKGQVLSRSGDAYIKQAGTTWKLGTAKVEKTLQLKNGHLLLIGFKDQVSHHEYIQGPSDPIRLEVDGQMMTGGSEDWNLVGVHTRTLPQKELSFEIVLRNSTIEVSEHFI